ncbi:MAG TPA: hypothetical protein VHU18_11250 [Rhizomicrobium sp.]|jgi:hypothetical protein|nr:hypothetical protein [Rhizomicrobium sp.]
MGVARLLAKGWLVICLFAAGHALVRAFSSHVLPAPALGGVAIPMLLFGAMGFLFIAGYGLSSGHLLSRFKPMHFVPGFDEIVFILFVLLSFLIQVAPHHLSSGILNALETAIRFAVPGQRALEENLVRCNLDGGRTFSAAVAWLLAFVFLGSAISRLRMSAALVRLERKRRIEPLGPQGIAFVLGVAGVTGIQFLFMGTLYRFLSCSLLNGITGALLIGVAPLLLAYLIFAALTNLLATHPEG